MKYALLTLVLGIVIGFFLKGQISPVSVSTKDTVYIKIPILKTSGEGRAKVRIQRDTVYVNNVEEIIDSLMQDQNEFRLYALQLAEDKAYQTPFRTISIDGTLEISGELLIGHRPIPPPGMFAWGIKFDDINIPVIKETIVEKPAFWVKPVLLLSAATAAYYLDKEPVIGLGASAIAVSLVVFEF